jgi:hypothetical protein
MSTPEPSGGVAADRPAVRGLFQRLFDDASVLPPGLAPLPQAVRDHVARQSGPYADLLGPLLLPVSAVGELVNLEHPPLEVALVGRPGTSPALVGEALSALGQRPGVTVAGVEIGWSDVWHHPAIWDSLPPGPGGGGILRSVEVPRDIGLGAALSDIQAHADDANPVQAKFRTGSVPGQPAPTAVELATFIRASVDQAVSFKLTGGLHHAISQSAPTGEDEVGFLNVIAATRWALAYGAEVPEMESLLCGHDPAPITDIVTRMSEADASVLRAFFTSYGCFGVMDPIRDLETLRLIEENAL